MPDILIRGMEMPRNCGACYLNHGEFCFMLCRKLNLPQEWEARPSNCPLVELPAHGDLIDRDALTAIAKNFCNQANGGMAEMMMGRIVRYVEETPVIVPASEEEANGS